jgi:small nuclear ribonucleoprotein
LRFLPTNFIYFGGKEMEPERPLDALNEARNQRVIVELKNKIQIIGKLKAFDIHINVVLEDAEEWENGSMKRKIGKAFIRGDTIILLSPA